MCKSFINVQSVYMTSKTPFSAFVITTGEFTTMVIPSGDLDGSNWNKYVYRVYSGAEVNEMTCAAMCVFDYHNDQAYSPYPDVRCQFTVLDSTTCYLGTLQEERSLLANPLIKDMNLKTSKFHKKAFLKLSLDNL
jgi:hypothetical protein